MSTRAFCPIWLFFLLAVLSCSDFFVFVLLCGSLYYSLDACFLTRDRKGIDPDLGRKDTIRISEKKCIFNKRKKLKLKNI